MDNFNSGIIEMLGAEYRADSHVQLDMDRLARQVAGPASPAPTEVLRSAVTRLGALVANVNVRRVSAWLGC